MNKIRPWLYIGKYAETTDHEWLKVNGITAMLLLAEPVKHLGIASLYLQVEDGIPIPDGLLEAGVDFIKKQKDAGQTILVACGAGVSRSGTYAIAALAKIEQLELLQATKEVKHSHPATFPHPELWLSLCEYLGKELSYSEMMRC